MKRVLKECAVGVACAGLVASSVMTNGVDILRLILYIRWIPFVWLARPGHAAYGVRPHQVSDIALYAQEPRSEKTLSLIFNQDYLGTTM